MGDPHTAAAGPEPGHAFESEPLAHKIVVGDLALAAYEWPGEDDPILLVHATGFHARCWRRVVHYLPGRHVYALDMPSHGYSDRKEPPYDWTHFGDDICGAIEGLGLQRVLGVGHSMGGHALVVAAAKLQERFRGLVLLDPVIVDPEHERHFRIPAGQHPIARRRNRWHSAEEMFDAFRNREPYSRWDPAVLRDYCRYGLVPSPDGEGMELACPPNLEAEVYAGMHMEDIYRAIGKIVLPVDVIRARARRPDDQPFDFSPSPTWPRLAGCFANARDEQLADRSHFIPMEMPRWTAERVLRFEASSCS